MNGRTFSQIPRKRGKSHHYHKSAYFVVITYLQVWKFKSKVEGESKLWHQMKTILPQRAYLGKMDTSSFENVALQTEVELMAPNLVNNFFRSDQLLTIWATGHLKERMNDLSI